MANEVVTLEELPELIKKRMPTPKDLKHLVVLNEAKAVSFEWQCRRFAVRTTLEAFEVKGKNLLITGASQLIQAVCQTATRNQKVIEEVVKLLLEAEELARSQQEMALQKIATATNLLKRLAKLSGISALKR